MTTFKKHLLALLLLSLGFQVSAQELHWPQWRGPDMNGIAKGNPPIEWSESKNIKWKTNIPGEGLGTPVATGDLIFFTSAVRQSNNEVAFYAYAINRKDGKIQWQKKLTQKESHAKIHAVNTYASASCITDGEYVIAFLGSYGLFCLDMGGNIIWKKDYINYGFKDPYAQGEGSSPFLYKDNLIVVYDHDGNSNIQVFDVKTGKSRWMKRRNEEISWATPIVYEGKKYTHIIVPGHKGSIGYDINNGAQLWRISGLGSSIITTPSFEDDILILNTGYWGGDKMQALDLKKLDAGVNPPSALLWEKNHSTSYVCTPQIYDGKVYYIDHNRTSISCVDLYTGKEYYSGQRPGNLGNIYASPIVADGHIYFLDRRGRCAVIEAGGSFKTISINALQDQTDASPIIVEDKLIIRGHNAIYCIED